MKKNKKLSIKKGDRVKIIAGDQKGLKGEIKSINYKKLTAILDISKLRSKFVKAPEKVEEKKIPMPIHVSNLMIWDGETNKISRIGFQMVENQKKRYFKKSGNLIETNNIKK